MTEFSPAEQKVIELVMKGLNNNECADALGISRKTIKFHLTNIYLKAGVKSRAQFMASIIKKQKMTEYYTLKGGNQSE